ncbi:hypothetical protein VE25_17855 [Devosia geojensis]|uniref:Uncharacterized protein n=1 Tax=Devosia geojensis TaxID=443610 RepID=A0A0F5FQJ4_9HYPH|nr:hypothetical protein [Devosia geojensis]KKB10462.1 hypothetical protein VE25_17855 [Devosia geojensis]
METLTPGQIERVRLTANLFNTIAAGLIVSGVVVPLIGVVYSGNELPRWNWGVGITIQAVLIIMAIILHLRARENLRELDK